MRRRTWLALGGASAAVLAIGGGTLALLRPGVDQARLTAPAREVFAAVGRGVLDGTLPTVDPDRAAALAGLLDRIDALVGALPPHAQAELSQLLALLATGGGRRALAGLSDPWRDASVQSIQHALQSMRMSSLDLRRQAYQALHDIVGGAYFADASTWPVLGYPGPRAVAA